MVVARASAGLDHADWRKSLEVIDLTDEERGWLGHLPGEPGFEVTCFVQRWWRGTGLGLTVRLTLAVLGPERGRELLEAYLDAVPNSSIFFIPEAMEFLDFVRRTAPEFPHLESIARFERARLKAAEAASMACPPLTGLLDTHRSRRIRRNESADLVSFGASAEELLGALIMGQPLPVADGRMFPILVAPHLPHLWRPATRDEEHLWDACRPASTLGQLLAEVAGDEPPLLELLTVGALWLETDPRESGAVDAVDLP